ncbi:MAG: 30S ribosomal protein THX [Bacteroidales bacterium]
MGKGDKKTKRGKIIRGSYGKTRPRKPAKTFMSQVAHHVENENMEVTGMPVEKEVKPVKDEEKALKESKQQQEKEIKSRQAPTGEKSAEKEKKEK